MTHKAANIVAVAAIATCGTAVPFLLQDSHSAPTGKVKDELIRFTHENGHRIVQWLNHGDSVSLDPIIHNNPLEHHGSTQEPKHDGYYLVSGECYENQIKIENLEEISKERADSLRQTTTVNYVDEYRKQQAEKRAGKSTPSVGY